RIDLKAAAPIDAAVDGWLQAIAARRDSPDAEELRSRVWEPIAKALPPGTHTVYLAHDGALTRLPWAALPGDRPGRILLEDYAFAVVPHGPALLAALQPRDKAPAERGTLVAVGGVAYDKEPTALPDPALAEARPAERGGKALRWPDLPGTERELK